MKGDFVDIRGGVTKKEIEDKESKEVCQYCGKKAKYVVKSGDEEIKLCKECNDKF